MSVPILTQGYPSWLRGVFFQTKLQIRQCRLVFFSFFKLYIFTVYLKDSFKSICTVKLLTAKRQSHRSSKMPNRPTMGNSPIPLQTRTIFFNKWLYGKKN